MTTLDNRWDWLFIDDEPDPKIAKEVLAKVKQQENDLLKRDVNSYKYEKVNSYTYLRSIPKS